LIEHSCRKQLIAPGQLTLGGHLKTGHRRILQNRPTEQNQDKSSYTLMPAV